MTTGQAFEIGRLRREVRRGWFDAARAASRRTTSLRARIAPLTDLMTPAAWACAGVAVACALGALLLHWAELRVAASVLVFLLLGAVVFVLGRHQLRAELDLSRDRVVVGERATGRLLVTNVRRRRTFPMTIELPVGSGRADLDLPSLAGAATHEDVFAIPTARRAVLTVGPVNAVRADPLRLLRRETDLTEPQLLHVHPRTVPIEGSAAGIINDLEGTTTRKLSDSDVSFHALRAYVPGDDRRYVHWKTTARTGTMMVRQFEETKRSHLLVAMSTRLDEYADQGELELAISVAGSLGVQTLRDQQALSVATSTRTLASPHPQRLLDQLSGVEFEPQAPRLSEFTRQAALASGQASVAVVVCGSVVQAADVRRAARRFSVDIRTIVVRSEPQAETTVRPFGGLDLVTVARLEDLPTAMRRLTR